MSKQSYGAIAVANIFLIGFLSGLTLSVVSWVDVVLLLATVPSGAAIGRAEWID